MRVKCPHCHCKAIVTHRVPISAKSDDIYVNCPNPDCGARSVMRISHVYDLTPPAATLTDAMHEWFANLPDDEKRALAKQYQPSLL